MHTISPYTIRCYDVTTKNEHNREGYALLNDIRGCDLFVILGEFLRGRGPGRLNVVDEDKKVYFFSDVVIDEQRREIYGFMRSGFYGIGASVIDVDSGDTVFEKNPNNADLIKHYFHFFIPRGCNEAICVFSSFRGDGVKSLFFSEFDVFFKTLLPLYVSSNPLSYERALQDWQDAIAKEIRVTKFKAVQQIEDIEINGGHVESLLSMKPKRRKNFGAFRQFFAQGSEQANLVEILSGMGTEVKTVVQLGKKKRIFRVGRDSNNVVCQIDFPDDMQLEQGMPILLETNEWVSGIIAEFCENLYPGVEGIYHELQD